MKRLFLRILFLDAAVFFSLEIEKQPSYLFHVVSAIFLNL